MHDTYFVVPNPEFSFLILATPILFAVVFAMIEIKIRLGYWLRAAQLQLGLYLLSLLCFLILPNYLPRSGDLESITTIGTIGAWALALSFIVFALIVANLGYRYRKSRNG